MATEYEVATKFTAVDDRVTIVLGQAAEKADKFGKAAEASEGKVSKLFKGATSEAVKAATAIAGLGAVMAAAKKSFDASVELESALVSAGTKFTDGTAGMVKQGSAAYKALEAAAVAASRTGVYSAQQAAEGLENLGAAGLDVKTAIGALPKVLAFAKVAGEDLGNASAMATDALGALGMASDKPEIYVANLGRVMDAMGTVADLTTASLGDVSEAMTEAGPIATSYKISLDQTSAALALFAQAGLKGSRAGTSFKNAVLNLSQQTGPAAQLMKKYHIAVGRTADGGVDLVKTFASLADATRKMDAVTKNDLIARIVGKESVAGVIGLLNQGADKIQSFADTVKSSTGSVDQKFAELGKTSEAGLGRATNAALGLGTMLAGQVKPQINGLVSKTAEWLEKTTKVYQENDALRGLLVGGVVSSVVGVAQAVAGAVGLYWQWRAAVALCTAYEVVATAVRTGAIASWIAQKFALAQVTIRMGLYNAVQTVTAIKNGIVAATTWAATAAQTAFNASLLGAVLVSAGVLVAIGLLVAGGVWLYKNWDLVKTKIGAAWDWIKAKTLGAVDVMMGPIRTLLAGMKAIGLGVGQVQTAATQAAAVSPGQGAGGPGGEGGAAPGSAGAAGTSGEVNVTVSAAPGSSASTSVASGSPGLNVFAPSSGGL